jgi:DNA gyrase subunit B
MVEKTLTTYQATRIRTEMYMGSRALHTQAVLCYDGKNIAIKEMTWVPSLYTAFRELIDNSLDEVVAHKHGDTIRVTYDPDTMEISVEDNGRGIPIHEIPAVGKGPAASFMMSNPHSGRNFDERGSVAGLNGLGAAIVNFTAEWFELDVWQDNKKLYQRWTEGVYGGKEIHKTDGPVVNAGTKGKTGTKVKFKPSNKVWKDTTLPLEFIESRMWDIAVCNPTLKVYFNGSQLVTEDKDPVATTMFANKNPSLLEIKTDRVHAKYYAVTGYDDNEHIHSLVNNIPVLQGGPHVDEFRSLFYGGLIKLLDAPVKKALGIKGKTDNILTRADVGQGVLIYNVTVMNDPHFDSQSKTRLVSEIKSDIKSGFFESDVSGFIRKNPKWVQAVIDRCKSRTSSASDRSLAKDQKKLSKTKIATLRDATGKSRKSCALFLTEGDSAAAGLVAARDPSIHGILPLRGKVMNVNGVSSKKVLSSKALTDIMGAIGLRIGETANPLHLRYGKIYITTDSDEDGKNITALLVNFLFTFWPELFGDSDNPIVYQFDTPLIILVKGKEREYIHADSYDTFVPSDWSGWQVIRAKGLARLTQPDWKKVINDPKLIPMTDDGKLKDVLSLIFDGDRADDRKTWLS